jgi:hypothetical protein
MKYAEYAIKYAEYGKKCAEYGKKYAVNENNMKNMERNMQNMPVQNMTKKYAEYVYCNIMMQNVNMPTGTLIYRICNTIC